MYTILVNDSNVLVTTIKERIMQRSKLVDNLHFLVNPTYKGLDMTKFTAVMEYVTPVSRELKTELLTQSGELYKGMIEYTLPFDTSLTKEAGEIELQLSFVYVEMDADGKSYQHVRKTTPTSITILAVPAWCDIVADDALTAIDQRLVQMDAMMNALNDMTQILSDTKADNIRYDKNSQVIQLTANGADIGDKIILNIPNSETEKCIKYLEINDVGELVVTYSDESVENVGKISGGAAMGIYIPDVSQDGILTMTLSQDVGEPSYSWDIDPSNDWNPVDEEAKTSYIWESL